MIPYFSFDSFQIGIFKFYVWGSFLSLALFAGMVFVFAYGKKIGWPAIKTVNLVLSVYAGALIGARFFYFLQPGIRESWNAIFDLNAGGMTLYGGLFGGILAGWFYIRKQTNWRQILDYLAPVIVFCLAIGRIGCFLINDHQGSETGLPWAIRWPDGILRHPVAPYLIIFDLVLAGFLWWRGRRIARQNLLQSLAGGIPSHPEGIRGDYKISQFGLFLVLYAIGRFFLDFTREPTIDPNYFGLAASQWVSLILLTFLILSFIIKKYRRIRS